MEMIDSGSGTANSTPKRDSSKRSSAEYMRAMASPVGGNRANEVGSPETPSPPYHARRSSTSLGYFTSPLHPRAGAILSKNETSSPSENAFVVPHSPGAPRSRLMPPTTPKSRNAEVFLSPPPKLKSPSVYKDNGKPIREISNGLKARLNYALVKLQNGWVDKTLPELENELDEPQRIPHQQPHLRPRYKGSYHNEYAAVEENDAYASSHSDEEGDNGNSAHLAFLKALTSPKKQHHQNAPPTSPLQWSGREKKSPSSKKEQPPSEVEAIETLMSLSSPQRTHPPQDFTLPVPTRNPDSNTNNNSVPVPTQQHQSTLPSSPSSSSSSSARSNSERLSNPLTQQGIGRLVRPLMVPKIQSQPSASELSPDSTSSNKPSELRYPQQQADIETDVEDSVGDDDDDIV